MSPQRRRPGDVQFPTLPPAVEPINTGTESVEREQLRTVEPAAVPSTEATDTGPAIQPAPEPEETTTEQPAPKPKKPSNRVSRLPEPAAGEDANAKVATTLQIRSWIRQRAQTAVLRTAGIEGGYNSMQAFVEGAMLRELDRLQREFNNGEPYPPNQQGFRTGRPLGS